MAESGDVLEDLSIAQGAVLVKSCEVPQDATEVNAMLDAREKEQSDEKRGHFFPYPEKRPIPSCTIFLGYTSNLVSSGLREFERLCEGKLQKSYMSSLLVPMCMIESSEAGTHERFTPLTSDG
ncbi:hypothetical protein ANCDUO_13273 [Ancylostoma duodenale]|uniref:Uncharacterized protein n=1 Tax=Ancylostoma duodenale TaxID=51022 RepID=A0A0C2D3A1_9BILA|nr:hypothetical protein ANCDUO_13273 [Ancylostoma duodenale]